MCWSGLCMLLLCKVKHIKEYCDNFSHLLGSSELTLKHLRWQYYPYLTYKTDNYSSNCIKINLRLLFWKKLMQSRLGHSRNFKLISKFSHMRPVFPDYLSISYDSGKTKDFEIQFPWRNKWPQYYIALKMKVWWEKWKILLVSGNQQFRKLSCMFCFYFKKFFPSKQHDYFAKRKSYRSSLFIEN